MRAPRVVTTLCCAFAMATVLMVSGARADEYTKLTYLTFSGPVQLPGVTLPAGTYMFKLADPNSGRRAIQVWDEKGTKIYATLLTISDEQPEAKDEPVVLFAERPSGVAPAVKSWFYPAERIGYEFIYPRSQAMKIAEGSNTSVLAYNDELKEDANEDAMRGTKVGRIDAQGRMADDAAATTAATANQAASDTAAREQTPATPATPATTAPTTASAPAADDTASASAAAPSANRTPAAPPAAPTDPTAQATTTTAPAAVGTSGQTNRASQAGQSADPAPRPDQLPRTASQLVTLQFLSIGLIAGALSVRQLRRRYAMNR